MGYDGRKAVIHKTRLMKIDPFKPGEQKHKDNTHRIYIAYKTAMCSKVIDNYLRMKFQRELPRVISYH